MFDFLKKKITDFTGKIREALEAKKTEAPQAPAEARPKEIPEAAKPEEKKRPEKQKTQKKKQEPAPKTWEKERAGEKAATKTGPEKTGEEIPEEKTPEGAPEKTEERIASEAEEEKILEEETPAEIAPKESAKTEQPQHKKSLWEAINIFRPKESEKPKEAEEKRELKAKTGFAEKLKGVVSGKITISEKDTKEFFGEFELSLLESDVEQETAEAIVAELKKELVGKEISSKENVTEFLKKRIAKALETIMTTETIDMLRMKEKPLKILFVGPNGAGKTTTIAKIANYFTSNGKSVILAASDTFRAASIEQLETHANRLNVKMVKHNYGSDPAAVAFDAVKAAEAKKIDVVLIDTAGRQDTNKNLIEEMKKIERVIKPHLKLYVGEAYTGQALLQQATEFNNAIGIDGFVLTKIDADAKGGTAISLLYKLKKPIVFVGTGQEYKDIMEFEPGFIIKRILG